MSTAFVPPRQLIVFGIIVPIAAILGYFLATPDTFDSIAVLGLVVGVLLIPLLLRWHHLLLILSWNAALSVFFLPGQPELWMVTAGVSLFFSSLNRLLAKEQTSTYVPSIVWSLAFLAVVALVTAKLTGGFGVRALGSSTFGGRRYVYVLAAILGYFALANQRIPANRAKLFASLFFLSAVTAMVSNLAFFGGPGFYFLYYIFPAVFAVQQAVAEFTMQGANVVRLVGFSFAAPAVFYAMLLRYGLRGVLDFGKPWRIAIFTTAFLAGLLGGFRSSVIMAGILFALMFYFERLFRTRLVLAALIGATLAGTGLITMSRHLPFAIQRSLSFLPIDVDPAARTDAESTTDWRLRMWNVLLPEIPKHFWVGKGFAVDSTELYLLQQALLRGMTEDIDVSIAGGSYHSGPLTLIIAFGVFGVIAFLWFGGASLRVLRDNYRYGDPELKIINTFLLSYFLMRFGYFLFFYGQFAEDLAVFTGTIGLSVSLNGGIRKPNAVKGEPLSEPVLSEINAR